MKNRGEDEQKRRNAQGPFTKRTKTKTPLLGGVQRFMGRRYLKRSLCFIGLWTPPFFKGWMDVSFLLDNGFKTGFQKDVKKKKLTDIGFFSFSGCWTLWFSFGFGLGTSFSRVWIEINNVYQSTSAAKLSGLR